MTDNDLPVACQALWTQIRGPSSYLSCLLNTTLQKVPRLHQKHWPPPGVEVSSATVRNVMSDLESMGLVRCRTRLWKNSNSRDSDFLSIHF